jgi:transcriptional regulator with XRE-family HTH domain
MTKDELKKRRERLGLTQTELAAILGFASNTVSGYETGRMEVPKFMDLVLEALEARQIKKLQTSIENN